MSASGGASSSSAPPPAGPAPPIERTRRAGKYKHPFGGMRIFAEDRARSSGWDVACLAFDGADARKLERGKVSDALADAYREAFIAINIKEGRGRPKANNISAAKKTVKMIAERVLLVLESRATELMFKEFASMRQGNEVELGRLRRIEKAGAEHPLLTYEEVVGLVRQKLKAEETMSDEFLPGEKLVRPETAIGNAVARASQGGMKELMDDDDAGREALKQALVEMRAEEIAKGSEPTLIGRKWVQQITAAASNLVTENYGKSYVESSEEGVVVGGDKVLGCEHFRRKNRVLMACCGTFPVCRMCHFLDQTRIHDIRVEAVETMLCVECGHVQSKAQNCARCNTQFGTYYCHECGITDSAVGVDGVDLRHCNICRVCMPGPTFHCDLCRACFNLPVAEHFAALHNHHNPVTPGASRSPSLPLHATPAPQGAIQHLQQGALHHLPQSHAPAPGHTLDSTEHAVLQHSMHAVHALALPQHLALPPASVPALTPAPAPGSLGGANGF